MAAVLGRLKPGVTIDEATHRLDDIAGELHARHPERWSDARGRAPAMGLVGERDVALTLFGREPIHSVMSPLLAVVGRASAPT